MSIRKQLESLKSLVIPYVGGSTGCQWAALPKDLRPRSTVNDYFRLWDYDGTLDRIHHALYVKCRELAGREVSPTAVDLLFARRHIEFGKYLRCEHTETYVELLPTSLCPCQPPRLQTLMF